MLKNRIAVLIRHGDIQDQRIRTRASWRVRENSQRFNSRRNSYDLRVAFVERQSEQLTSFLLIVMIIAIFVFAPIGRPALYWLILSRVVGVAVVAGIAYEIIRWAGRNRNKAWVRGLMWPGLQLQKLTTRPPSLDQLAVSIAALQAVLAVENPAASTEEDRLGMEVVA